MSEAREYLIKKGSYFYRPNSQGYTSFKFDAGRYTKDQAEKEAAIEPWHMQAIHQDDVPEETAPDKEFAKMKRALANWRDEVGKLHSQIATKEEQIDRFSTEIKRLEAIEKASRRLAYVVRKSVNAGPISNDPTAEGQAWRELRAALGEELAPDAPSHRASNKG